MSKKHIQSATAASESVVSRLLSKILRVSPQDTLEAVSDVYDQYPCAQSTHRELIMQCATSRLYPWVVDVVGQVMSERPTPLVEDVVSLSGVPHLVKDTQRTSEDSLWLVVADPAINLQCAFKQTPCHGLIKTRRIGAECVTIFAIQLSSCLI